MLVISEADVERLLDLTELRDTMERALMDLSAGRVVQPVRSVVSVPEHQGWFGLMPAVYRDVFGAKLVAVYPANEKAGVPTHQATIQLFRAATGEPLAVLGGRVITALRTAAVSALATRELSRRDARVLAILGSGVQARTHFHALSLVRNFEEVRVWSRTPEHAARFAQEIGAKAMTAKEAVQDADVIVTVTHSSRPVLKGAWLKENVHINAVGAVGPKAREIDDEAMNKGIVIIESREAASQESADIIQSNARIYAELGELLAGTKHKPEESTSIYKSLGVAVEDIAAARLVYEKAVRKPAPGKL